MPQPPREPDPRTRARLWRRAAEDDATRRLLRDTHAELRQDPEEAWRGTETGSPRPVPLRSSPRYWAWSISLVLAVGVAVIAATLAAQLYVLADPPQGGVAVAWPWALVGVGGLAAGGAVIWSAWPKRPSQMHWVRPILGAFGAIMVTFGLLTLAWFVRVAAA